MQKGGSAGLLKSDAIRKVVILDVGGMQAVSVTTQNPSYDSKRDSSGRHKSSKPVSKLQLASGTASLITVRGAGIAWECVWKQAPRSPLVE